MNTQTLTPNQRQRWIARTLNTIAASRGLHMQRDLARTIGWTETKLSRKLHQEVRFSLEDVDHIAAALGIDSSDLLNGWNGRVPVPEGDLPFRGVNPTVDTHECHSPTCVTAGTTRDDWELAS